MTDGLTQGPKAGRHWPAEVETYEDPETGATVRRLTNYPGVPDWHLYFTECGWYGEDDRRLLFRSRRDGSKNLYSMDLETGLIEQVTDLPDLREAAFDREREVAYVWVGRRLAAVDLDTLEVGAPIYEVPDGYEPGSSDVAADGETLYVSIGEEMDLGPDATLAERHDEYPHTKILAVPTDGGDPELLHEEDYWASSHVLASPTRPELLTFCHEGPWHEVDNRIWGLNAETGEVWAIRETGENEEVGHEYWLADGEHVGYHGAYGDPEAVDDWDEMDGFLGTVRYDDTDRVEFSIPVRATHTHANARDLIVCDGSPRVPYVLVYRRSDGGEYEGPRLLAGHEWTWTENSPHPHSRLSPDGETVLFDSDHGGEHSDLYLADVPDFEDLPEFDPEVHTAYDIDGE